MALTVTVAPSAEPLSLAEVKSHLRVEHDDDDTLISGLIAGARGYAESVTKRALITQEWEWKLDSFALRLDIPKPPLQTVDSIKYLDTDGAEQTLVDTEYRVDADSQPGRVTEAYLATWPAVRNVTNAVTVAFTAGYGSTGADVPQPIRLAMLLLIGHWYENREGVIVGTNAGELPIAVDALLGPYQMVYF